MSGIQDPTGETRRLAMSRMRRHSGDFTPVEVRSALKRSTTRSSLQEHVGSAEPVSPRNSFARRSSQSNSQDPLGEGEFGDRISFTSTRSGNQDPTVEVRRVAVSRMQWQSSSGFTPVEVRSAMARTSVRSQDSSETTVPDAEYRSSWSKRSAQSSLQSASTMRELMDLQSSSVKLPGAPFSPQGSMQKCPLQSSSFAPFGSSAGSESSSRPTLLSSLSRLPGNSTAAGLLECLRDVIPSGAAPGTGKPPQCSSNENRNSLHNDDERCFGSGCSETSAVDSSDEATAEQTIQALSKEDSVVASHIGKGGRRKMPSYMQRMSQAVGMIAAMLTRAR